MENRSGLPLYWPFILALIVLIVLLFFAFRILRPVPKDPNLVQEAPAVTEPQPAQTVPDFGNQHVVQPGETLSIIAGNYSTTVDELVRINGIQNPDLVEPGQVLVLPSASAGNVISSTGWLLPDHELVYGPSVQGFNVADYVQQQGGFLAQHSELVENQHQMTGAEIVQLVADRFSVNPKLLLTMLEYRSQWVTAGTADNYPAGFRTGGYEGLHQQLRRVANQLNLGYYGRAEGGLTGFQLADGTNVSFAGEINHGTAGLMNALASHSAGNYASWQYDVSEQGFMNTYARMFGNPFDSKNIELIPSNLQQPSLALPWPVGQTWYFTGGPHGAWASGSAWAGIDFAPPDEKFNCFVSDFFATAVSAGTIVRSDKGAVVLDLDGDNFAGTGWAITYMHLADQDRVPVGSRVNIGDPIGRPSCEGGFSSATHLHLSRSYNGRWISADGTIPFNLEGWVSQGSGTEYNGTLIKNNVAVSALNGRGANSITK